MISAYAKGSLMTGEKTVYKDVKKCIKKQWIVCHEVSHASDQSNKNQEENQHTAKQN